MHYAPESLPYAKNRYLKEVERHYRVINDRLGSAKFLAGSTFSIADMAHWGWAASVGYIFGEKGLADYPHVARFMEDMAKRPAVQRALKMKQQHTFKSEFDDVAKRAMFPQNAAA